MTSNKIHTFNKKNEKGLSLILVILVGSIMLVTVLAMSEYAQRLVSSQQVRGEAVQDLYNAEDAFECVKFWLKRDYRHFSTIDGGGVDPTDPALPPENPVCNGYEFDFQTENIVEGFRTTYNAFIGEFRIPTNSSGAGVVVQVERPNNNQIFDGEVRVYSQSNDADGFKTAERFHSYDYRVLYGADIMFVVDRSGSIEDGGDRSIRPANNDWNKMLDAVNDSIRLLGGRIPAPYIGIVSFGTNADDTGVQTSENCADPVCNWREPDVKLTDNSGDLIDDMGTVSENDDEPKMNLDYASTNLSLGMSIAGAELMGKYYPHTGTDPLTYDIDTFNDEYSSGDFEDIVARGHSVNTNEYNRFDHLPSQSSFNDRDDTIYPDVMVIVTDGAPNGIMTHIQNTYNRSTVDFSNNFVLPTTPYTYNVGEVKLFRTLTDGPGDLVYGVDGGVGAYTFCSDDGGEDPESYFPVGSQLRDNSYPMYAMCNGSLVAEALKARGINIIAVYVGDKNTTVGDPNFSIAPYWLEQSVASLDGHGDPLFAAIENYEDLNEALLYLFEQLEIVQAR